MIRIREPISYVAKVILGISGVTVFVVIYFYLSRLQHIKNPDDTTIPSLSQLWDGFVQVCAPRENSLQTAMGIESTSSGWRGSWLYKDAFATYSRLLKGLGWGCLASVVIGVLMGCYEWLASLLLPPLSLFAKIPGTAMLAVFFVLVGTGESMFIAMIGFGVMPTLIQSIYLAAKDDLHEEEIDKAYTLGASHFEVIWNIVFQQVLPKILDNIRLQIGPAMVCLIAAEMLVGEVGMGYQIRMQQRLLHMNVVYVYLLILGMTGLLMDRTMILLRERLCPWYDKEN